MTYPAIRPRHDLTPMEIDGLEDGLYAFNVSRTGYRDGQGLGFIAEVEGVMVGAVAGYTWGGVSELRQVFVDEAHRGKGLGLALVQAAIAEARARGVRHVFLSTYDFQAPGFYRRLGFVEIARIEDKPLGHTDHIMRLTFE